MRSVSIGILPALCALLMLSPGAAAPARLTRASIDAELKARAARYLARNQLSVDYYRIGRRLAFSLPVEQIPRPELPVPGIPDYPWEIWFSWELEQRLNSLGWAAQWFGDEFAAAAAARELRGIAAWPGFTSTGRIDLCLGHVARTLCQACSRWSWVDPETRDVVGHALDRLVAQAGPWVETRYPADLSVGQIMASEERYSRVHNIPFIGLIGAALAANTRASDAAAALNRRVTILLEVLFRLRARGYSEGVAYDGYLLDFIAGWIQTLPPAQREAVLKRFDFGETVNSSYMMGAPGDLARVAEIADVEPLQMPFHISAQARLQLMQSAPVRAWYLGQLRPDILRSDALACLRPVIEGLESAAAAPAAGALDAGYARVLRSGWRAGDLAVAVAASTSPAGHIHLDFGSITIGTAGQWLIADPGYQQYMAGAEREFTIGSNAHNTPILNGKSQTIKSGRVLQAGPDGAGGFRVKVDISRCYPAEIGDGRVFRTVWLSGDHCIVLADEISLANLETIAYTWHGSPDSAWRIRDNWAMLYGEPDSLVWFSSPSCHITEAGLDRSAGSRGQLSLSVQAQKTPVVWWVFSRGAAPPAVEVATDGRSVRTSGRRFAVD